MVDDLEDVHMAHEADDLALSTVESRTAMSVSCQPSLFIPLCTTRHYEAKHSFLGGVSTGQYISKVTDPSQTLKLNTRTHG